MFRKLLMLGVAGSLLMFSLAAFALTPDEAKANIDKQTTEKKLRVKDHSQADNTSKITSHGVNKEHGSGKVTTATNASAGGKNSGTTAGTATNNASGTMHHERNGNHHHNRDMDHDRDRDMMHNHMGGGSGMRHGYGMDHGSHMGYGPGSGMGPGMGGWHR